MLQVIPNSHFWTNLEMLLNGVRYYDESFERVSLKEYLLVGLANTVKQGYELRKTRKNRRTKKAV